MKFSNAIIALVFLSIFPSCNSTVTRSPTDPGINPFTNGGSERNMIVVISDIHLGANIAYAEIKNNLSYLEKLLEQIRVAPNVRELVIAGDMLDEWFVPATINTYDGKDQNDFVKRIAATNKGVIDAFNKIIQEGNITVTYVPGNHDLTITEENVAAILPGINQARDPEQGLGTYSPAGYPEIAIEHGHRYNFFCAPDPLSNQDIAPGSILPPGYFYTRIAVLYISQNYPPAGDTVETVTPNQLGGESQHLAYVYWNIWKKVLQQFPITNKFNDKIIVTNIDGHNETYMLNDLLPYQLSPGGFIDVRLFKGIQDTWNQRQVLNRVQVNIPVEQAITNSASATQTNDQARIQYFMNPNSNKRLVVFGHTHAARIDSSLNYLGQKSIYANSGTWIDHNPNLTKMNFVVITPQNTNNSSQTYVKLYNFEGEVVTQMAVNSLQF